MYIFSKLEMSSVLIFTFFLQVQRINVNQFSSNKELEDIKKRVLDVCRAVDKINKEKVHVLYQ